MLKPQAHAGQINNPHHASPHVTQTSKGRRAEESRETWGELDLPLDALSQSGRDEDSSSAALSPLLNPISCYDMVAGDVSRALIRHFLLQPAGLLAVVSAGWGKCHVSLLNTTDIWLKTYFTDKKKGEYTYILFVPHKLIEPNGYLSKQQRGPGFPKSLKKSKKNIRFVQHHWNWERSSVISGEHLCLEFKKWCLILQKEG